MKKSCFVILALFISLAIQASPVSEEQARRLGRGFVTANFEFTRQGGDMELVYQTPYFYVYNVGSDGFVIISSDDSFRPVIGYSDEGAFNPNDIPPALVDYFDGICEVRSMALRRGVTAKPDVKADWDQLRLTGKLVSRNGGRGVDYMIKTKWNQDYPYNYLCPADPAGPGGHTYVGCLATAMCQLTRFWSYPVHGNGSHCYIHDDYGEICADFENTYYDWEHMPDVLTSNSSEEEKIAVGTIGFHCGVTLDMGYGPDGSGGPSDPIPAVMNQYFSYSEHNVKRNRNDYDLETWKDMVKEQFDMGWPMYYGGCDDGGCHAFNCDGYDDYDMFHFNLGWGGSSNGWYIIDEAPYTHPADAMFNFVPEPVYNAAPMAATDFTVTPASDVALSATLSWTNPTETLGGTALGNIDQVIVTRGNVVVYAGDNVTPGATMTITDANVPYYDCFDYKVQAVVNGKPGKVALVKKVAFGPTCGWTIMAGTTSFQGWRGGRITVYNACGTVMGSVTLESSTTQNVTVNVPVGRVYFDWTSPDTQLSNIFFLVKDAGGTTMYSFNGPSEEMTEGIFLEANNGCGNTGSCVVPSNLITDNQQDEVHLSWTSNGAPTYGFLVYRDGQICRLVQEGNEYVETDLPIGGHCYRVSALCENGESEKSNESCVSIGECYPPRNLDYEYVGSSYQPKLTWERPSHSDGLSGYYLFRSSEKDGQYSRIKLISASATSYQDNTVSVEGDYYYKLYAAYNGLDCTSAPASYIYDDNQFYLHVYYSPTNIGEDENGLVSIYPNPTRDTFVVKGEGIMQVSVYNVIGQKIAETNCVCNEMTLSLGYVDSGVYFVRVRTVNGDVTRPISIIR